MASGLAGFPSFARFFSLHVAQGQESRRCRKGVVEDLSIVPFDLQAFSWRVSMI